MSKRKNSNPNGSGNIRKRIKNGKEFFEARATIGRDPKTGKQIQKSVYGKTQREVSKKLREMTRSVDKGIYYEPTRLTVSQWFDIWIDDYTGHLAPLTLKKYKADYQNHIKPELGNIKLKSLTPSQVQKFINKSSETLSPKSVKNLHGVLHRALETACEIETIPKNPAEYTKLPKVKKEPIHPLDKDDQAKFRQIISGTMYEDFYILSIYTGMRLSEQIGLTWDRVDFENGSILIDRQLLRFDGQYNFTTPKHNKIRTISPGAVAMDLLRQIRTEQLENRMAAGSAWNNPEGFVFTDELGKHRVAQTISKHFKEYAKKIGRPEAKMHDLRHTYAVNALQAGIDYKTLSEFMGHASVAFTLDIYADVTADMRKDSAAKMDAFLNKL